MKSDYQPTKTELEEEFKLDVPGKTVDQRTENVEVLPIYLVVGSH